MKKFTTMLLLVALATTASAQVQFAGRHDAGRYLLRPQMSHRSQAPRHVLGELVTTQPEGEARQYVRSGSRVRNMPVLFSNDPDPEHQYFTEWYMTPECIPATLAQVRALPITAETIFYAKQIRQYELTVDANGGYFYDDPEHTTEVLHINEKKTTMTREPHSRAGITMRIVHSRSA